MPALAGGRGVIRGIRSVRGIGRDDHGVDGGIKFVQARARHDHRIAPAVRLLRDAQESSALVLAEFDDVMFALHLELSAGNDGIHRGPWTGLVWSGEKSRVLCHSPPPDERDFFPGLAS